MTWFKDLDISESFDFLRDQTISFSIKSSDGECLYAWHILPIELYRQHESSLVEQSFDFASNITSRYVFNLLREDSDARLIIHLHNAEGTVDSDYRVSNYRALSADDLRSIHVLTFDYCDFERSFDTSTERELCIDAISVIEWAMKVVDIPSSRILIFDQFMRTAVDLAVADRFVSQSPPVVFVKSILVVSFVDVATLVTTYRIASLVLILSSLTRLPLLFNYLSTFVKNKWSSKDRIAQYIFTNEVNEHQYRLTLIHAKNDFDILSHHTQLLFWHVVNATLSYEVSNDDFNEMKIKARTNLSAEGFVMKWRTKKSFIREEILKTGLHNAIMSNSVISIAVMRMLETEALLCTSNDNIENSGKKHTFATLKS